MIDTKQDLLLEPETLPVRVLNGQCQLRETDGMRTVLLAGIPVFHYSKDDKAAEALWVVQGIDSGWLKTAEVASALELNRVTVYRNCRRYVSDGTLGLVSRKRGPKGARLGTEREVAIRKWHAAGKSAYEMGGLLGVSHNTVLSAMRRMGLEVGTPRRKQESLPLVPVQEPKTPSESRTPDVVIKSARFFSTIESDICQ